MSNSKFYAPCVLLLCKSCRQGSRWAGTAFWLVCSTAMAAMIVVVAPSLRSTSHARKRRRRARTPLHYYTVGRPIALHGHILRTKIVRQIDMYIVHRIVSWWNYYIVIRAWVPFSFICVALSFTQWKLLEKIWLTHIIIQTELPQS